MIMPVSILVSDLKRELDIQMLLKEIQKAVKQRTPQFANCVEYRVRDDEKIAISLPGVFGLLEIELDDTTMVHMYSSMLCNLEKLQICLAVLDHLTEKYGGDYDKEEIHVLRKLMGGM